jgi:hypothetical protein
MARELEIQIGDVTDVEAHVLARYPGGLDVVINGKLRGPICEKARTLPADFEFRAVNTDKGDGAVAEAIVTDPCMWTEEMPHWYQVDVEARQGVRLVAEYHGKIGLRRLAPRRPVDFAPGTG